MWGACSAVTCAGETEEEDDLSRVRVKGYPTLTSTRAAGIRSVNLDSMLAVSMQSVPVSVLSI